MVSKSNVRRRLRFAAPILLVISFAAQASAQAQPQIDDAACREAGAKGCVELALQAMGGRERLESIRNLRIDAMSHTALTEQSYRQDPFVTSYAHVNETIDFEHGRVHRETHGTWPESDPGQAAFDMTLIADAAGGVYHRTEGDAPCSLGDLDSVREALALGPARMLLVASAATDLHFDAAEVLRSTPHLAVAFAWHGAPVRVLINPFNHLPDAIETRRTFRDFWYFWGDVRQKIYFDNWQVFHGIVYPTNSVEERNGIIWQSTQVLNLEINVAADDALFQMDRAAAQKSADGKGWDRPFNAAHPTELAPGITLFEGAWNSTIVKQDDGIYILEAPISSLYTQGVIDEAKKRYPDVPIKGVFSTSDSWPHTGGVRQCVALGLPVYILDLNRALLDREIAAPHTMRPDLLALSTTGAATREALGADGTSAAGEAAAVANRAKWRIVAGKVVVGSGPNRAELYPIRGASTERQYMVYFPERYLLYASDTLVLNDNGSLYDPELMREVTAAVAREGLNVTTVFAMHQGPVAWKQVEDLVRTATSPATSASSN
jgi:hypothetical protein